MHGVWGGGQPEVQRVRQCLLLLHKPSGEQRRSVRKSIIEEKTYVDENHWNWHWQNPSLKKSFWRKSTGRHTSLLVHPARLWRVRWVEEISLVYFVSVFWQKYGFPNLKFWSKRFAVGTWELPGCWQRSSSSISCTWWGGLSARASWAGLDFENIFQPNQELCCTQGSPMCLGCYFPAHGYTCRF